MPYEAGRTTVFHGGPWRSNDLLAGFRMGRELNGKAANSG